MIDLHLFVVENGGEPAVRIECSSVGQTRPPLPRVSRRALSVLARRASRALAGSTRPTTLLRLVRNLFDQIFTGENRELLARAWGRAEAQEAALCLVVRCSRGALVERLPWELLHDGTRFLAADPRSSVVRYFDEPLPVRTLAVAAPLRVLVTTASPPGLQELDLEAEEMAIREAYEEDRHVVELTVAHRISLHKLADLLRRTRLALQPFHVWHHCGHGGRVDGERGHEFRLFFEGRAAQSYAGVEQLGTLIGQNPDLRLAVVAACYGGSSFGLAPQLARLSLPAVVGFPGPIADGAARRFSFVLHQCLPRLPIELAVGEARRALAVERPGTPDWAMPLLFSRRTDRGPILRQAPAGAGLGEDPAAWRPGREAVLPLGAGTRPPSGLPPLAPLPPGPALRFSREEIAARESRLRQVVAELDERLQARAHRRRWRPGGPAS